MQIRFRLIFALALSLGAHVLVYWGLGRLPQPPPAKRERPKVVTVDIRDLPTRKKRPPTSKPADTGFRGTKGQVVDLPPNPQDETDTFVASKYLSDRFRKVEKETRAALTGPRRPGTTLSPPPPGGEGKGKVRQGKAKPEGKPSPPRGKMRSKKGQASPARKKKGKKISPRKGNVNTDKPSLLVRSPEGEKEDRAPATDRNAPPSPPALSGGLPSGKDLVQALDERLNRGLFAASDNHFLPDLEKGAETRLNTTILSVGGESGAIGRDTRYYSYFQRIRRALELTWRPDVAIRQALRLGERFPENRVVTTLEVTLNGDGSLQGIKVVTPSGIQALDREAVRAMEESAPFYNPPPGLIERGRVRLSEIFLPYPAGASPLERVEIQGQAQEIRKEIEEGAPFEEMARTYSGSQSAAVGGDLGFVEFSSLRPAFQRALTPLRTGEITPPIDTEEGVYLLKLTDERDGRIRFRFSFIVEG